MVQSRVTRGSIGAVSVAVVLLAAACGSSGSSSSSNTTTAAASSNTTTAGSSSTAAGASGSAADLKLANPLKLQFLWEIKGESADAISDFQNGAQLAVDDINAAGGVGGHPINAGRTSYSASDPQAATTDFLNAVQTNPDIIIGFDGPSIDAVIPNITKAGIPSLGLFEDAATDYSTNSGSPWLFNMSQAGDSVGTAGMTYLVQTLGKKSVGLITDNEAFGQSNLASSEAQLKSMGLAPFATRTVSPAATDLTAQVLAMKGADSLGVWAYPNVLGVEMNEALQNGINVPTITGSDGLIANSFKLVKSEALPNLYAVSFCDPAATNPSTNMASFIAEYKAKYGGLPSNYAPLAYDAVYMAVAAVKQAGSVDKTAVKNALQTVKYTDGSCASEYASDGAHVLIHENQVSHFATDGTSTIVAKYPVPPKS